MDEQVQGKLDRYGWHIVIGTFAWPVIQLAMLLCIIRRIDVVQVWICFAANLIVLPAGILIVARANPELVNHRGRWRKKKDTQAWDKVLLQLFGLSGLYLSTIIAAIDINMNEQPPLAPGFSAAGIVLCVAGNVILHWAMFVNRHFETTVRLQTDRHQTVVTDGPYQYVRHPGYVGAILWLLSGPLMLGSGIALFPAGAGCLVLVLRTYLEDRMLHKDLPGYADYARHVRYRLVWGVW